MLRNSKKSIPEANTTAVLVSCKSVLVEETTIFTMLLFFFTDVSARKNFSFIDFGTSVGSCRQVKL